MKALIIILLILTACAKEPQPEPVEQTVCYECISETQHTYFLHTSPKEMQLVIKFWEARGIELKCKLIKCEQ